MNLLDLPNFSKCCDTLMHYCHFTRPVEDSLDCNRSGRAGVDDAFVVANRNESSTIVEDAPVFFDQSHQCAGFILSEMR